MQEEEGAPECEICTARVTDTVLICGHELCSQCFARMQTDKQLKTCPFCRGALQKARKKPPLPPCRPLTALEAVDGRTKLVEQMLLARRQNAVLDVHGNTPLHVAAQNGQLAVTKLLIRMRYDVDGKNRAGQTPLHYSVAYNYVDVVYCLMCSGASDTIRNNYGLTCYEGLSPRKGRRRRRREDAD
jgi:hypothetical protein